MKELERKVMIFVGNLNDVIPHLVHCRLKPREQRFNTLTRQLDQILVLTTIGLKQCYLHGISTFMEILKVSPYLVSNLEIANSVR